MNNPSEKEYYKRQIILSEIGDTGQQKLKEASVLVIGAGGLGSPLLSYIAAAGIGSITIYDHDIINESNLHRQILFSPKDIGKNKAVIAASKLSDQNPYIQVTGVPSKFNSKVKVENVDIIIDCSDNFTTKFLAHDLAYKYKKLFTVASIHKFEGQVQVFDFRNTNSTTNCMRCLWKDKPSNDCVQSCEEAGVIGAVAGVLGTVQAMETIKAILDLNTLSNEQNLIVNLLDFSSFKLKLSKNANCPLCSAKENNNIDNLILGSNQSIPSELEITLETAVNDKYKIINMTSNSLAFKTCLSTNLDSIAIDIKEKKDIDKTDKIAIICNKGINSLKAARVLRKDGYSNSFSIMGGAEQVNSREE